MFSDELCGREADFDHQELSRGTKRQRVLFGPLQSSEEPEVGFAHKSAGENDVGTGAINAAMD
jgi:hypothetical protein